MKLDDLIEALAGEIELTEPDLRGGLEQLAALDADAPGFLDALDQYSGVAQRMGEAAEVAGFPGLQAVCTQVVENTLQISVLAPADRGKVIDFLSRWPSLVVQYLRNLQDSSAAVALVEHLRSAPSPVSEAQGMKIAHMLGSLPAQASPILGGAPDEARPVLASAADVALILPGDVDQKLLEGFFQEAPEQARYLVQLAATLASGQGGVAELVAAKRIVHTMKGSGSIIGLRGLTSLGHHLEDILEHYERDGGALHKAAADVLTDSAFCLEQMIGYALGEDEYPQQAQSVLQAVLDVANRIDRGESLESLGQRAVGPVGNPQAQGGPPTEAQHAALRPNDAAAGAAAVAPVAALRVSVDRVDEMFRVSGEVSVHTAAMEARLKELTERARDLLAQNLRVQARLFELENLADVRSPATLRARGRRGADGPSQAGGGGIDPLELDQYSELHSSVHALIEEASDSRILAQRIEEEIARTVSTQARQRRLSGDLQHLVIGTRMTEVAVLESRLQRNIRATCQATGKLADLVLEGGSTLIDGDTLNRLADPLLHVLRNAVDHGLETPEERLAAGKPETGRITLAFSRQGQQVVLRCIDDGRGLDYAAIRRRAVERGLLGADQAASEEELGRMILMAGFSTRQTVSEVSGRGVGMDVVREWVAGMNGSIRISSQAGRGCVMELRFAATLSTMQVLVVDVCGQRFALPSVQIEQAVPRGVGEFGMAMDEMVFRHQKRVLPAFVLADAASVSDGVPKRFEDYDAVIVRINDKPHALAVDGLIDARELLVKNPGRYARHVRGVAGLSILGDGSIAVNLDLSQLVGQRGLPKLGARGGHGSTPTIAVRRELPSILIVDDSLSVRNSLLQLIQDSGFRASAARDGVEAINAMREFKPDLVLTDLEMPNMNGLELASHIKGQAHLKHLPIIMITSRSQDKHRRMAEQAGVDVYFTKPYNEGELLVAIRQALAGAAVAA